MSSQQTLGFGRFLLDFVAATFRTRHRSLAAMHPVPTSSRRKRKHVSYKIDEEVAIRAPFLVNPSLADEDAEDDAYVNFILRYLSSGTKSSEDAKAVNR